MNCISCGHALTSSNDPTQRFIDCADCGTRNDLAGVEEHTMAQTRVRPPSRRSLVMNMVGRTLGNGMYRIDSEIGGGGMAKVYCATQLRLDRKVAVKVLPQELTEDPNFVQRFKREATVLARFSHASIVPVFDTGEEEGIHYIVMGYIEGPAGKASTLRDLIDAEPLDVKHASRIMRQCLSALQYAHEKLIIHRDIKPGNILIDGKGDAHLADFGIASSRGAVGDATLTVSGSTLGTVRYMAPEQTESASHADARSDLYSLGLVFYEMLVGYVPEAKTFLPGELLTTKKKSKAFILPSVFKPGQIDEQLDQIILRAIQPDPADRFQSAAEMIEALTAAIGGEHATGTGTTGTRKRLAAQRPRKRLAWAGAAVLLLGAVAIGAEFYHTAGIRIPADLLAALKSGDNAKAISMVDKQPDLVNRADIDGLTPLHHAASQNLPDAADDFLKNGAKLEAKDHKGRTPLHLAALNNRPAMVVLLLGKGARQEAADNENKTPQQLASDSNSKEARLVFERSDLIHAIAKNDLPTIKKLVTDDVAMSASEENWTALHYAAYKGDDYTTKLLLDKGARVDAQTTKDYSLDIRYEAGRTPLLLACQFSKQIGKYPAVVTQLLEKGASPDGADTNGFTPLHFAAKNLDLDIAQLLVARAKPDAVSTSGVTPLHLAAQGGSDALVKLLLEHGAKPSLADNKGLTALQMAAAAGHVEVVKILLPLTTTNDARMAARKLAIDNKQDAVATEFDRWWRDELFHTIEQPSSNSEAEKKQLTTMGELLQWPDRHLGATTRPSDGRNPLAVAVALSQPSTDLLNLLLSSQPALVGVPDSSGESPLYFAVRNGKTDLASLLASKADRKAMDSNDPRGQRLLNVAVASGNAPTVDLLIKTYQLSVNQPDASGATPLQVAAQRADPDLVQALLSDGAKPELAALNTIGKATSPANPLNSSGYSKTVNILGTALLMNQLQDSKTTEKSLSDAFAKFDELKYDPLDKSLPNGQLPLQMAFRSGSDDARSFLGDRVTKRNLLNAQNAAGETVLHTVAALGQADVVDGLLKAGCDYTKKDNAGRTPEDAAKANNQDATARILADCRQKEEKVRADAIKIVDDAKKAAEAARTQAEGAAVDAHGSIQAADIPRAKAAAAAAANAAEAAKRAAATAVAEATQYPRFGLAEDATAAGTAKDAAVAAAQTAAHDEQLTEIEDARHKSVIAAIAWFKDIYDRHQILAIDGGAKLEFKGMLLGGIQIFVQGTDHTVTCDCSSSGLLTVVSEVNQLPNMGAGDAHTVTRQIITQKIVGQHTEYREDRKHKTQIPYTVNDTQDVVNNVQVTVHTYSGPLLQRSPKIFEWQVGDKRYVVSTEAR